MHLVSQLLILIVALLHTFFLVVEMFLWTKPYGLKAFGLTKEKAEQTKVMALNQGLYNGFLAAGLFWSLFERKDLAIFFLICVVIAGVVGAFSASRKILFIQALPAFLALLSIYLL